MSEGRRLGVTPSQTVGPFFAYVLTPRAYGYPEIATNRLVTADSVGERLRIEGYVLDGDGEPIIDAMLEIWQADGDGRYASGDRANAAFTGFGRSDVDSNGFFSFETVKPGRVPGPNGAAGPLQAPHINLGIFARGLLKRLFTRIYFEGDPANAEDPILALVPASRRDTLIARRRSRGGEPAYDFTIRLQGEGETVFFEA